MAEIVRMRMKHMSERVLVVDDTPMNIDLLEGVLTPVGYTVDSAKSSEDALFSPLQLSPTR